MKLFKALFAALLLSVATLGAPNTASAGDDGARAAGRMLQLFGRMIEEQAMRKHGRHYYDPEWHDDEEYDHEPRWRRRPLPPVGGGYGPYCWDEVVGNGVDRTGRTYSVTRKRCD